MKTFQKLGKNISFRNAVIIAFIILISYLAVISLLQDEQLRVMGSDLIMPIASLLAAASLFYAAHCSARHSRRLYAAWGILALAQLSWALGDVTWMIYEVILRQNPFPSVADGFYLAYYPLFLLGVFHLPAMPLKRRELIKMILDMSIVMLGALLVFWNFLIGPIVTTSIAEPLLSRILSAAYPVFDLVLLVALLMIIFHRLDVQTQRPLLLLAGSAVVMIVSDSLFGYQSLLGIYVSGALPDIGYVVAILLAGLAGVLQAITIQPTDPKETQSVPESETPRKLIIWPLYLPYLWLIIPFFMLIWSHYYQLHMKFSTLAFGVISIMVLAIIRQFLTLNENKWLYQRLQQTHDELEIRVRQRTSELAKANEELKAEIIERKRIEEELKLKAQLLDAATDSIMLHDLDGNFIYLNKKAYELRGYTKDEMMEMNLYDLNVPEYAKLIKPRTKELMEKGQAIFESVNLCKDKSSLPVEVHAQVIESEGRKLILSVARDITERKRAENELKKYHEHLEELVEERTAELKRINEKLRREINDRKKAEKALKESEAYYRSLFENTGTATVIIEEDTTISMANAEVEKISGYSKEEIKGKSWTEFVVNEDLEGVTEYYNLRRIDPEAAPRHYEFRIIDKHGDVKNIFATVGIILGTKKTLASLLDITEHRLAEDRIKQSLKEKEVLLREIHHRVKNNLQIISSLLSLQSRYIKDKEAFELFMESQARVKSIAGVHEKLYQSKDLTRVDFADYIKSLSSNLLYTYAAYPNLIKLNINVEDVSLNIETAIPLGLIVNELLTNSIKHAFPDGREGEIRIDLRPTDDRIELVVGDNGVGFPEDLDFRKTESLGMQLVFELVDQLDGEIELDRSHGTEFKIVFGELEYEERI